MRLAVLAVTHIAALAVGFAAGVYFLPILVAPPAPSAADARAPAAGAQYSAQFRRERKASDFLHWGEGAVSVARDRVALAEGLRRAPITSSTSLRSSSIRRRAFCASRTDRSAPAT